MVDPSAFRLGFAFSAGMATFFAPCAFPLLPGYVAYYLGRDVAEPPEAGTRMRLARASTVGVVTSLGFFLVYAALAGVVLAVGTRPLQHISVLELVIGVLLIGLGLGMSFGWLRPDRLHVQLPARRRSLTGFLGFGIAYAAAAAGCTAPVFIGIAAFALSGGPTTAIATLLAYAAGMSVLMIGVTLASALGRQHVLRSLTRNTGRITRASGVLLVLAGIVQIYLFLFEFGGLQLLGLA